MIDPLQLISGSLVPAAVYALIGVSFVIVYKTTRVLNFAQGQLCLLSGYILWAVNGYLGGRFGFALIAVLVLAAIIGAIAYFTLMAPLTGHGVLILVMLTIIVGSLLQTGAGIAWGTDTKFIQSPVSRAGIHLPGSAVLSQLDLAIVASSILVVGAIWLMVRFTRLGAAMRATAESPILASYRGVNIIRVSALAWSVATVAVFLAGIDLSVRSSVSLDMVSIGFVGFAAILIGGIDSIEGAVVGAVVVALVQSLATSLLGGQWSDVVAFMLLLVTLLIRPYGLFGSKEFLRV